MSDDTSKKKYLCSKCNTEFAIADDMENSCPWCGEVQIYTPTEDNRHDYYWTEFDENEIARALKPRLEFLGLKTSQLPIIIEKVPWGKLMYI